MGTLLITSVDARVRANREQQLLDGFGGMLSFELEGGVAAADSFIDHVTLPISAPSLTGRMGLPLPSVSCTTSKKPTVNQVANTLLRVVRWPKSLFFNSSCCPN